MASASSKSIPFVVLIIACGAIVFDHYTGSVDTLESLLPMLVPLGVGGIAKRVLTDAIQVKKTIPKQLEKTMLDQVDKKLKGIN